MVSRQELTLNLGKDCQVAKQRKTVSARKKFHHHIEIIDRLERVVQFHHKRVVRNGKDIAFVCNEIPDINIRPRLEYAVCREMAAQTFDFSQSGFSS